MNCRQAQEFFLEPAASGHTMSAHPRCRMAINQTPPPVPPKERKRQKRKQSQSNPNEPVASGHRAIDKTPPAA